MNMYESQFFNTEITNLEILRGEVSGSVILVLLVPLPPWEVRQRQLKLKFHNHQHRQRQCPLIPAIQSGQAYLLNVFLGLTQVLGETGPYRHFTAQ